LTWFRLRVIPRRSHNLRATIRIAHLRIRLVGEILLPAIQRICLVVSRLGRAQKAFSRDIQTAAFAAKINGNNERHGEAHGHDGCHRPQHAHCPSAGTDGGQEQGGCISQLLRRIAELGNLSGELMVHDNGDANGPRRKIRKGVAEFHHFGTFEKAEWCPRWNWWKTRGFGR
jgi:hypothetical protein